MIYIITTRRSNGRYNSYYQNFNKNNKFFKYLNINLTLKNKYSYIILK